MKSFPLGKSWVTAAFLLAGVRFVRADVALDAAIAGAWQLAETKTTATISYLKATYPTNHLVKYPADTATDGKWNAVDANTFKGWVSGFYPGTLWLLYEKTGDPKWLQHAKDWTAGIEAVKSNPLDHDIGFRFMCSLYHGYRLSTESNDPGGPYRMAARDNLATAAATLDTRFNKGGIPVGGIKCLDGWKEPYPVIIDTMMNISLLFTAWDLGGRPNSGPGRNWFDHAVAHANTTLARNLRTSGSSDPDSRRDGSTYHCVNHNDGTGGRPADGSVLRKITIQGFSHESTWSRGQAWALYGFTDTYRQTKDDPSVSPQRFLEAARNVADYFISRLPHNHTADPYNHVLGDFVPPSDFDASLGEPAGPWSAGRPGTKAFTLRDSSAAAIGASGLLQLSILEPDTSRKTTYFLAAENIIRCLLTFTGRDSTLDYLGKNSTQMGILIGASRLWNDPQKSLIYGDYYLLEALTRYQAIRSLPSFGNWLGQYFTAAQLPDSSLTSDLADPDGDAIPNLIEYAMGLHPRVADAGSETLPRLKPLAGSEGAVLEFTYDRRLDRPDLVYGVETATGCDDWVPAADERVGVQGQIEKRRTLLDTAGPFRLVRLKIVRRN